MSHCIAICGTVGHLRKIEVVFAARVPAWQFV
jgi:hypothetical protein